MSAVCLRPGPVCRCEIAMRTAVFLRSLVVSVGLSLATASASATDFHLQEATIAEIQQAILAGSSRASSS